MRGSRDVWRGATRGMVRSMDELVALATALVFTAFVVVSLFFVLHVVVALALVVLLWLTPGILKGLFGRRPQQPRA